MDNFSGLCMVINGVLQFGFKDGDQVLVPGIIKYIEFTEPLFLIIQDGGRLTCFCQLTHLMNKKRRD